ncbi:MAG: hypothetical protein GX444_04815, partial [Myxococcales bacterium]|nr:hypothetical protein [Myxococcales bacterium]
MKTYLFLVFGCLFFIASTVAVAGTIPGFEAGGHYYSQAGNPNPNPIAPGSPNYWCTVACLHMLFDYWDDIGNAPGLYPGGLLGGNLLPQEEIGWVVNVNDVQGRFGAAGNLYNGAGAHNGTLFGDDRRGAHFSTISVAPQPPLPPVILGYSWQILQTPDHYGYTAINGDWTALAGTLAQLKAFIDADLPVIVHINPSFRPNGISGSVPLPPETAMGHSILLIGYHVTAKAVELEFHDPWFGPNVRYEENNFFNNVWPWAGARLMLFAAPWDRAIELTPPGSVVEGEDFNFTVEVTYQDGLPPIAGSGVAVTVATDQAFLDWSPDAGISLQTGQ